MSSGRYEVMRTNENAPQMRRAGNEKHDRWAELKKKVQIPPSYQLSMEEIIEGDFILDEAGVLILF